TYLNVANNRLSGFVPDAIQYMTQEGSAFLSQNMFWCPIPTIWAALAPMSCTEIYILSASPPKGLMTGGGTVSLTGINFPEEDDLELFCTFGNRASTPFISVNSTLGRCRIPDGAPGVRSITLTQKGRQVSLN